MGGRVSVLHWEWVKAENAWEAAMVERYGEAGWRLNYGDAANDPELDTLSRAKTEARVKWHNAATAGLSRSR